jgi:hypothetical protein
MSQSIIPKHCHDINCSLRMMSPIIQRIPFQDVLTEKGGARTFFILLADFLFQDMEPQICCQNMWTKKAPTRNLNQGHDVDHSFFRDIVLHCSLLCVVLEIIDGDRTSKDSLISSEMVTLKIDTGGQSPVVLGLIFPKRGPRHQMQWFRREPTCTMRTMIHFL